MDASVASLMEKKAGIDGQSIRGRWVVDCVKERKWAVTATLVNGLCFFGERQELCRKLWLISDERPRIDWDRLRFNLEPSKEDYVRYVE